MTEGLPGAEQAAQKVLKAPMALAAVPLALPALAVLRPVALGLALVLP